MSNQKYEITDIAHEKYPFLHRIRALRDIGDRVKAGDELIAFDRDKIGRAGHSDMVIMVLTNPGRAGDISWQTGRRVRAFADAVAVINGAV